MDEIQRKYRIKKRIYLFLVVAFFAILITFRFISSPVEHKASVTELVLFACLLLIVVLIYVVFRCPACNASLVRSLSLWKRLQFCPKCGVRLVEK